MEENRGLFDFAGDDIYSSAPKQEYEDIVSDSRYRGRHYQKKRRGNAFTKWWGRRRIWQKTLMVCVLTLAVVVSAGFAAIRILFDYNYNDISKNPEDLGFESVINEKIVNVALFGIDSRDPDSFTGLSDSIMIMSLNTETKTVKLVSVMRDSLVPITYDGKTRYAKINSAYSKGGPELAIKTLNTIFGLDISEYATVNFYGMSDIIDAVGGIDVTLAEGEINVYGYENGRRVNWGINGCIAEQCAYMDLDPDDYYIDEAGPQHLNGVQAVAYARIRHAKNIDGTPDDFGRTDRQRYVMEQLFNKAITLSKTEYVKLARALIPCSETSLSYSEIMSLAVSVLLSSPTFEQERVPMYDYLMDSKYVSGVGSCVYYDLDFAKKLIHAFFYDDITPEEYIEQFGIEQNDWYTGGSGGSGGGGSTSSYTRPSGGSSSSHTSSSDTSSGDTSTSEPTDSSGDTTTEPSEPTDSSDSSGSSSSDSSDSSGSSSSDSSDSSGSSSSESSSSGSSSSSTPSGGGETSGGGNTVV